MSNDKKQDIKELFSSLDEVVEKLEGNDISLEDSFQLYHKGMELLKQCNEQIDHIEKQVQILDQEGDTCE